MLAIIADIIAELEAIDTLACEGKQADITVDHIQGILVRAYELERLITERRGV